MKGLALKMDWELRCLTSDSEERKYVNYLPCGTNTTTMQVTLVSALEASILDVHNRASLNIHLIGAAAPEYSALLTFEELLHLLPSLDSLALTFVGPKVPE